MTSQPDDVGPPVIDYSAPPDLVGLVDRILDADDETALELERANIIATDNGLRATDPTDQPEAV